LLTAILHAAGGPLFVVCCGGSAAMGCMGETWGGWCHVPCGDFSVACGTQTAVGSVLVAMCVTHAALPPAHQGTRLKVAHGERPFLALFRSAQVPT
jgi:hypothetical protein